MISRRDLLQLGAVGGTCLAFHPNITRALAQQRITQDELLNFDSKGQITLLHLTDLHAQLNPVYFRAPDTNIGVGPHAGIPPHIVGKAFLEYFGIEPGSPEAYAFTMVDYVDLAKAYGKVGGLDRIATLVKAIRADRGEDNVLLLDGGDTWQGSYTSLKTNGQDVVDCMKLLGPEAMVGHWEFTFGEDRVLEIIEDMGYPFLASNIVDTEWEEPVFESTAFFEKGGVNIAVIGQAMPYTPIANPSWLIPNWSFGIRPELLQENIHRARDSGAQVVVLLSHNGYDTDYKLAGLLSGVDVILTGHTHDAIPRATEINGTLLLPSGSHGKYLGRIDLEVRDGKVVDHASRLIPVFSDVIESDRDMAAKIAEVRAPYEAEATAVIGKADALLYRRGNFNGSWDDVICDGLIQERDAQIALSPGFRWGTTLLPGQDITIDDLYTQTSMSYPNAYRLEFTGAQLKDILEDVCDNLFNKDPFRQQGGDMVRVGGMSYACAPASEMGQRISEMTLDNGEPVEADRTYVVAGWASVNEGVDGPAIYELMETYIRDRGVVAPSREAAVKIELP